MRAITIFQLIAEKQEQYYHTLPNEIRELIGKVEGAGFMYKGQKAMVKCIYTDSTADISVLDEETGEETEMNVQLADM